MIPQSDETLYLAEETVEEEQIQTSRTYKIDYENKRILSNKVDGLEALRQAIVKILSTERYEHIVYDDDYGSEIMSMNKDGGQSYIKGQLQRRITEALMHDDRIQSIDEFKFEFGSDWVLVSFTVNSIYGNHVEEKEVAL